MSPTLQRPIADATLSADDVRELFSVARQAIAQAARGESASMPPSSRALPLPAGVFVTLRTATGDLRGCVGHLELRESNLVAAVADCARAAATRDWRFPPVSPAEVAALKLELSLLGQREPVADPHALDPRVYGVVVEEGVRRGVLLPDIPGIDTVADQLAIARKKAGIASHATPELYRFTVQKLVE